MPYVNVDVEVDVEDVLDSLSDSELDKLLERRAAGLSAHDDEPSWNGPLGHKSRKDLLQAIFDQQRKAGAPSDEMREFIWREIGRIL